MTAIRAKRIAACLAMVTCRCFAQDGAVQIYGRLQVGLEHVAAAPDAAGASTALTREVNYRSVLGFRGSEELAGGVHALFQVEGTLAPDTGAGGIASRDTRAGIDGKFGTLYAGQWVTPYTAATSALDPFYTTTAGYASIMGNGSAPSTDNVLDTAAFDRRQQNTIAYASPRVDGMALQLAHGMNEERPAGGARPALTSLAASYEAGPWFVVAAHERHVDYQGQGRVDTGAKLAIGYRIGTLRLAAIAEALHYATASGPLDRRALYLAATQVLGAHSLRASAAHAGDASGTATDTIGAIRSGPHTGANQVTVGYDYALSPRSSVFAFVTRLRNGAQGSADVPINGLGAVRGATLRASAIGLRHWF